ncbi:tRNA pseudouridine(55) synthase TruB [Porphyromonas catoniae]|uniref:tRNA pseudouridine(55) synthase TruB n=1 Tax=Porphyromonas catoniae TaxID=41976 RepID=UPI0028D1ED93|nr:tRNA pseudouridine(55) synthase TruB [Porphyromonas catoniae]
MEKLDLIAGATIALDKPLTWSSFSLVNKFRYEACRFLGIRKLKVGHAGTLDPLATGVMILCTGKHTKHIPQLQEGRKEYIADIRLGQTTPTYDMESEPDAFFPTDHITRELVLERLQGFVGTIEQVPPAFSAVKVDGKRAYDLARKGRDFELKAKTLVIDEIELLDYTLPDIQIRVVCSKGTYIRALARDIGIALGSGGHLTALRRTRVGEFTLADCYRVEDIRSFLHQHVAPLDTTNE